MNDYSWVTPGVSFLVAGFAGGYFLKWWRMWRSRRRSLPSQRVVWRKSPEHVRRQEKVRKATAGRPRQSQVRIRGVVRKPPVE